MTLRPILSKFPQMWGFVFFSFLTLCTVQSTVYLFSHLSIDNFCIFLRRLVYALASTFRMHITCTMHKLCVFFSFWFPAYINHQLLTNSCSVPSIEQSTLISLDSLTVLTHCSEKKEFRNSYKFPNIPLRNLASNKESSSFQKKTCNSL